MREVELSKPLPVSIEAEEAVIGGVLIDNAALDVALEIVCAEDFERLENRKVFAAMAGLRQRNEPVDLVTVAGELRARNELRDVGGASYIAELAERVPTAANLAYYAKEVRRCSERRRAIRIGGEIIQRALESGQSLDGTVQGLAGKIAALGGTGKPAATYSQMVTDMVVGVERRAAGETSGELGTGLRDLDAHMGGFFPDRHYLIAGRTSIGKSSLILTWINHIAGRLNVGVGLISCEMSTEQVIQRQVAMETGLPVTSIARKRMEGDWLRRLYEGAERVSQWPMEIAEDVRELPAVEAMIRGMVNRGARIVIVDHIGLLRHPDAELKPWKQMGEIGKTLRYLARKLHIPILSAVQVNRDVKEQKDHRPQLWNLREAGSLEEDSDAVLFIHRPHYYDKLQPKDEAEVIVAKDRHGEQGVVRVRWDWQTASFRDRDDDVDWEVQLDGIKGNDTAYAAADD